MKDQERIRSLSNVLEQIDDAVLMTDRTGNITFANQAFYKHTGYSKAETIGHNANILKSGHHDQVFYTKMWEIILSGKVFRNQLINRKKNGEIYYEQKTITPVKDEYGDVISFVSTSQDITMTIEMTKKLEKMATTDQLTGIYNRHRFEELFENELIRTHRYGNPFSLIMFDIDHFKQVNDTYGHDVGDHVLKTVVEIIQTTLRVNDIFARWGGEEFLILCPETTLEIGSKVAEKLRSFIEFHSFKEVKHITASFGVIEANKPYTKQELLKYVDEMLYKAKEGGRNTIEVFRGEQP